MTTTLLFVRHGSTEWTAPPSRYQGRTDLPLSARGRAEAEQLADRIRAIKFDAIYSSPLRRTRETALALAAGRRPVRFETDRRIIELSYGEWEGKRHTEVEENEPDALTAWAAGITPPPGGESRISLMRRVAGFLDDVTGPGTVAVVTHKEVIRAGAIALGLLHPADYLILEVPCASIFSAVGEPRAWVCLPDIACELSGV
ncbi:MAG TPA: histidine phosphatase family protein [Candidatus Dormibacteraeota bacterium]|nr:histidine phosphatase family protein [Candidatus Dormibacteraeota bacterium]